MSEELLQRLLRLAPLWVRDLVVASAVSGLALAASYSVFHPVLDPVLIRVIDVSNINALNCSAVSLLIIAPVWAAIRLWKFRAARQVLNSIDLIEAAMERARLPERERMTVRRSLIKGLAEAAKSNTITAINLQDAANREAPGLFKDTQDRTSVAR